MRRFLIVCIFPVLAVVTAKAQVALPLFASIPDSAEQKFLIGYISKAQITQDTVFGWYAKHAKYVKPRKEHVEIVKERAYDFQILMFTGTWCHDSQQILPKYFSLLEAAEFPDHQMIIIGVDRQKVSPGNLQRIFKVVNIPTFIVLQHGVEVGRIVEYGNTGLPENELVDLIKKLPK